MCESSVYVKKGESEELVMENVARIIPVGGGKYHLAGLLGETREVEGELQTIDLMAHKIVFV